MKSLSDQVRERLAFDIKFAVKDSQEPWNANPSDCHFIGMKHEHARTAALTEALVQAVEAAEKQVERWYRKPPVAEGGDFLAGMYEMKQAIARITEALKEKK